ncbi:hypothetical protein [Brevundimonas sp.]
MKRLFSLTAFLIALCATPAAFAADGDTLPPMSAQGQSEADRLMEPFFTTLQNGDATKAYTDLFRGTLLEQKTTEIAQLASQTTFITTTYGSISDWRVIKSECVTPDFCKLSYLIRAAEGPIGFWAYLYRQPSGVWEPNFVLIGTTPQFFFD